MAQNIGLPPTFVKGFHNEENVRKMEYRRLGKTNLMVSKLSIGGGTLASFYGQVDENDAIKTIQKAIQNGINFIDTSPAYGQGESERIIGEALKGIPRQAYYIGTKVGRYEAGMANRFNFSSRKVEEGFRISLNLLGLEYVDIIQMHDVEFADSYDILLSETLPSLQKFVKEGTAKFIGLTGYPLNVLKEIVEAAPRNSFDVCLAYCRYTLFDDTLSEYLPFFKEHDIGIICASVLGMGILTQNGPQPWHPARSDLKALCQKAAAHCQKNNVDLADLAINHAMGLNEASTFLIGMQRGNLLEANLKTYLSGLSPREQEVLDYLKKNIFTTSHHWEGSELEGYRARDK